MGAAAMLAETEGFEPSVRNLSLRRFSKPLVSATHPCLRDGFRATAYISGDPIVQPGRNAPPHRIITMSANPAACPILAPFEGPVPEIDSSGRDIDSARRRFMDGKAWCALIWREECVGELPC